MLIPKERDEVKEYIQGIKQEFSLLRPLIRSDRKITQIHFGGGSPTAIPVHYLGEIIDMLTSAFSLADNAEIAVEVHPGYLSAEDWRELLTLPFTRMSLGIQDFQEEVLTVAGRKKPQQPIREIVPNIQAAGKRVNLDFIYGLPFQSADSFAQTIEDAITIRPDRIVTFSYAHVPWLHPQQQKLEKKGLPSLYEKQNAYNRAKEIALNAGYLPIGLDHFVVPDDPLAVSKTKHLLHRNFQGYCPKDISGQVYALGVTGIAQLQDSYAQNIKTLPEYFSALNNHQLPTAIGYKLTPEESLARDIITDLMCNYQTNPLSHAQKYALNIDSLEKLPFLDTRRLQEMMKDGLCSLDKNRLIISPEWHLFVRTVASAFDLHYTPENPVGYSKPI